MALPTLNDAEEWIKALYIGDPGSGKTTAAASMVKLGGRVIVVDAEAGLKKRPLKRLGIDPGRIIPYSIKGYQDLDKLYWATKANIDEWTAKFEAGEVPADDPDRITGVIFDSFTEIQKTLLRSIIDARYAKSQKMARQVGYEVDDDPFATDRDEYGKMTEMCRLAARRFRDLPCHAAFVTLARRDVDKEGDGSIVYRPALTPAFASDLMGFVDVALFMVEEETDDLKDFSRYVAHTRPVGRLRGKDRFGATPPMFPNPTFDRLAAFVWQEDQEPEDFWAADPFVQQRLIRRGELPDPAKENQEPILS